MNNLSNQKEEQGQIIICKQLIERKDYKSALVIIEEFLLKHPEDADLLNDKGIILTKLGRFDEAIKIFENALVKSNKNEKSNKNIIWNNKGIVYCKQSNFDEAIFCFDNALITNDRYTIALNNQGLAYYYKGKYGRKNEDREENFREAIICFNKVLELNDNNSNALNNKGSALLELGWNEESTRCIYRAIELDSKNANALNNRGRILANCSKYNEAIEYYNKALEIDPNHREAMNNKGLALANLGNLTDEKEYFSQAEICYNKAIDIDNRYVDAFNNKAMLYVSNHKYLKADDIIEESLGIENENPDTIDKKGIILFHLQKYDDALKQFKDVTEKNHKKSPEYKISKYHMGNVYMKIKKYDEAIECFDDSLNDNLNFAEAHNAKASALFNKGKQNDASKEIKRAIEIKPSLAVANENIAKLTSSGSQHFQNFWDFWKSSIFKKIVGVTLFVLILSTAISITFYIVSNIIKGLNSTNDVNSTNVIQLMDISEGYLIILAVILFILLIPEIKKAKMGPMEFELQEQHIHPTSNTPSMSEEHHFSPHFK